MMDYVIHYKDPSSNWNEATPIGNSFLGAMVFGGTKEDKLVLNEETIYSEEKNYPELKNFGEKIRRIREFLADNREYDAEQWALENFNDCITEVKSYEYAGNLIIKYEEELQEIKNYKRDLDIVNGIATVSYSSGDKNYRREYFASYPDRILCSRYSCTDPVTATVSFERVSFDSVTAEGNHILAKATTQFGGHKFAVAVKIETDGKTSSDEKSIKISDACYFDLYVRIYTDFRTSEYLSDAREFIRNANCSYNSIKRRHVEDFAPIMKRSDIRFEQDRTLDEINVTMRIKRLIRDCDAEDFRLMSLYWQFGKYLMLSSSRPGSLPANLQGIWADGIDVPWRGVFFTNINVQMNYWQAEQAGIGECTLPLFNFMNSILMPAAERFAAEKYGTRGLVVHHLTSPYGYAGVADGIWGLWPMGGAWLAYHLWEHYLYTDDKEFLKNTAYRFIKESVLFVMDNLFEGKDGYLHSGPSTSPENTYLDDEGRPVKLSMSPTMDIQIISGLLKFYIKTEEILCIDADNKHCAEECLGKLVHMQVGKYGQLQEWHKDYEETELGHRHISHAFGLYPADLITRKKTPDLYDAVEKSIDRRLSYGGAGTGWSRAWVINLFARLHRGEDAYRNVRALFTNSTYNNLFDKHPPFQIDGNFGGSAGIGEMVLQSHEDTISIIPAVPEYLNGEFRNLKARHNVTVSAKWNNGKVIWAEISTPDRRTVKLEVPGESVREYDVDRNLRIVF